MMTIPQARCRAQFAVQKEYQVERSAFSLHYLGIYKLKHAFEVDFKPKEGIVSEQGLPIIMLVAAGKIQIIQSGESLDIKYYFWEKKNRYKF